MKRNSRNTQPNIQNLPTKTEDFKRIMEALRNKKDIKERSNV